MKCQSRETVRRREKVSPAALTDDGDGRQFYLYLRVLKKPD